MNAIRTRLAIYCLLLWGFSLAAVDTLIPAGAVWKYLDTGVDMGTIWREPAFDDTSWASGPAQLGFGDGDEATTINHFPNGQPIITAYFRKVFTVADASIYSNLTVRLLRDDGGIVYINGVEVFRSAMPATNPITYSTLASITADGTNEMTFFSRLIPGSVLVNGANLVAVELHQSALASSDMSFDLQLLGGGSGSQNTPPVANGQSVAVNQNTSRPITLSGADADNDPLTFSIVTGPSHGALSGTPPSVVYTPASGYTGPDNFTFKVNDGKVDSSPATVSITVVAPPPPPNLLVATNAVWRYLDTGIDPGTAWTGLGYNDSSWASGAAQLGFGDGDEKTVINSMPNGSRIVTAYFRRTFVVSNLQQVASLAIRFWRDDGGIVYINGQEVLRDNMPPGPVNYSTLASANAGDDGNVPVAATVPAGMLVPGGNVIAVEVHQVNLASSDMSFMLELRFNTGVVSNHPPVAVSKSVTLDEDTSAAITLQGSDVDGNLLGFSYGQPSHGVVTGVAPNVTYQPAADYNGPDSFTFSVNDGRGGVAVGTISLSVTPVNDPPIAVARAASTDDPGTFVRSLVVIAPDNVAGGVILDGTASSDIDGDTLQYAWFANGNSTPFSTEPTVTGSLLVGDYSITLVVSDGAATASDTISVQVFTPCGVVENLAAQVQAADLLPNERNALLGHCNAACATFNAGNTEAGIHQLQLFQVRVHNKIEPGNPSLAQVLTQGAQDIINGIQ